MSALDAAKILQLTLPTTNGIDCKDCEGKGYTVNIGRKECTNCEYDIYSRD